MSIFLKKDAIHELIVHVAASKINAKIELSSRHFRKFQNSDQTLFSCLNVRQAPRKMLKTAGKGFGGYRHKINLSTAHERGLEAS